VAASDGSEPDPDPEKPSDVEPNREVPPEVRGDPDAIPVIISTETWSLFRVEVVYKGTYRSMKA